MACNNTFSKAIAIFCAIYSLKRSIFNPHILKKYNIRSAVLIKYDSKIVKEVIEDNNDDEKETMKRLLEKVAEYFGIQYDKFAKDNLNIAWNKKGHKS